MAAFLQQHQAIIAIVILAGTFGAFVLERYPPAVVAIVSAALYLLLGYISTRDLLAVFSNSAPITIAAMLILSGALVRTGALEAAANWIVSLSAMRPRLTLVSFFVGATGASAFANNTPVVAVLMTVVKRLAGAMKIPSTMLLIPLSYAAILGGTCTLIGTSTNLLVDGVARHAGMDAFAIFEITPVGVVTALTGLTTMLILAPWLLPSRTSTSDLANAQDRMEFLAEVVVSGTASDLGKAVKEVRALSHDDVSIVSVESHGVRIDGRIEEHALSPGDRITVRTNLTELLTLRADRSFSGPPARAGESPSTDKILMEAVYAPPVVGTPRRRLADIGLDRFGVELVAVGRRRQLIGRSLRNVWIYPADRMLLEGTPEGLLAAAEGAGLVNITPPSARSLRRKKAPLAIAVVASVVVLAALNVMPIEGLAVIAVAVMLASGCIDADEAWQSIDANILMLIFAMLAIGAGLEKSGAVKLIVGSLEPLLRSASPVGILFAIYFLAVLLTEVITNNAVAIVLTPIAIGFAHNMHVDARPLVIAVMFGASACFATPIGYQTNTMVYGTGNYRFTDFLKIGIPMNIIVGIATCTAIVLFMPFGN